MLPVPFLPPWFPCLRHLRPAGGSLRTTVRLENAWWLAIDTFAAQDGLNWQQWAIDALKTKPEQVGVAGWLRLSVLEASAGTREAPETHPRNTQREQELTNG